ncbi:MAG: hypothetical protein VXY47_03505 [Bacteroidota bacterium]|nr:hypothetical protein [Bacteroidota bacterium]MEC8968944.1 hypothetical protein [Bacteroidota bacterium]
MNLNELRQTKDNYYVVPRTTTISTKKSVKDIILEKSNDISDKTIDFIFDLISQNGYVIKEK